MFVREGNVFTSASDLTAAVACEWALIRRLDAKLGRVAAVDDEDDPMLRRASELGGVHERRELDRLVAEHGVHVPGSAGGVAVIEEPASKGDLAALALSMEQTVKALGDGAAVVFQATFVDEGFVGFADFLIRDGDAGGRPRYAVYDTKLARKAKITALLQLAAYAGQLRRLDVPVADEAHLILGDRSTSTHRLADIEPVFVDRYARLRDMVDERMADTSAIEWGAPGYSACGRCAECAAQVEAHRDVLLVAGLRGTQRARLADAGIRTIDELAGSDGPVTGVGTATLDKLRAQARMQVAAPPPGDDGTRPVAYVVHDRLGLAALPSPDEGDIFFDFEGDPLWSDESGRDWGLDYLWGLVDHDGEPEHFRAFWAHDRAEEKQALLDFLDYVQKRRVRYPNLHIYHYADYERAHLQALCARYGVGEQVLDELLREHVLVDLYPVVKRSIRISERSYSLKKLEPLYMGDELRQGDVKNAAASITAYVDYTELVAAGRDDEAAALLADIADYNRYDCVSTHRLRDWLIARADESGVARRDEFVPPTPRDERIERAEDEARGRLLRSVEGVPSRERSAEQNALALTAAAIEYHRREDKTYWWEHFNREVSPVEEWADQRDVFIPERIEVESDWAVEGRRRQPARVLVLRGVLTPGSRLDPGATPFAMYEEPLPARCAPVPPGNRGEHAATTVLSVGVEDTTTVIRLEERASSEDETWTGFPVALTPAAPIPTGQQRAAILEWGQEIVRTLPHLAADPALDLLRRTPPRLQNGGPLPQPTETDSWRPIVQAATQLDRSYLAVQGPPGSGKTYVGAKVIAELVRAHRWRIGVVAQSHEVVENLLRRVIAEGIDPDLVGKRPPSSGWGIAPPWTSIDESRDVMGFQLARRASGYVLGGTAWTFANASQVARLGLDLLVVDEAGQFSLANTIAVGVSARNLLLLGDPQQLPQVSQGLHPEPIDTSALGWLSHGHDVLPPELGYFLSQTWRMHPELCRAVSTLSYEGRLTSRVPETLERRLSHSAPGLHAVPVTHTDNSTDSPEEAAAVVDLVRAHVGREWTDPSAGRVDDPIRPSDIIVVAPYNAQVGLIRAALDAAGFGATRVGTVDKFQGQEAAVAIVSLTASSPAEAARGLSFLLMRNRLNVAISRAKWAAYLVHSPGLKEYLPHTAEGVAELAGFLRLVTPRA